MRRINEFNYIKPNIENKWKLNQSANTYEKVYFNHLNIFKKCNKSKPLSGALNTD